MAPSTTGPSQRATLQSATGLQSNKTSRNSEVPMAQARQIHSIAQGVKSKLQSTDNSLIQSTHSTTSEGFTADQKRKALLFFGRLRLIYGHRFTMQWPDEQTVKLARREWAKDLE